MYLPNAFGASERHALVGTTAARLVSADAAADLVFAKAGKPGDVAEWPALPAQMLQAVREGRSILVVDASGEGWAHSEAMSGPIHRTLAELSIPSERVAYLTQNREFSEAYVPWAVGSGLRPMIVLHHDAYIRRLFLGLEDKGPALFDERLAAFKTRRTERSRRFVALNYAPRPYRVLLLLHLIRAGLWGAGHISFPGFDKTANSRAASRKGLEAQLRGEVAGWEDLSGFSGLIAELLPYMDELAAKGSIVLGPVRRSKGRPGHFKSLTDEMALAEYHDAWFSIVPETEMGETRRVTEKSFKPLLNFSPILILGNPRSLDLVRGFGFQTFGAFWNEDYDREPDAPRRFEMLAAEVERLCRLSDGEWAQLEGRMAETIVYNARWGLLHMPRRYREMDQALVDRLMTVRAAIGPSA